MNTEPFNISGKTNLHDFLSLVKYSELLISPDSGPIHTSNMCWSASSRFVWSN